MKDFDIEKLEKRMPYSVPENFFEEFSAQTIAKIEAQKRRKRKLIIVRMVASCASVAAMVVIMLNVWSVNTFSINELDLNIPSSENVLLSSVEIDSFLNELSDEELTQLMSEVNHEEEFYDYLSQ